MNEERIETMDEERIETMDDVAKENEE